MNQLEPNDVIERYKEVKKQVDQMDEEEISSLAKRVAAAASTIEDPSDSIVSNVIAFFTQEKISSEERILGIRTLTGNMASRLVSEKLAVLLAADIEKVQPGFWERDDEDKGLIMEIDVCNDLAKLIRYTRRTDLSKRVRRVAALKVSRVTTDTEMQVRYATIADVLAPKEESK